MALEQPHLGHCSDTYAVIAAGACFEIELPLELDEVGPKCEICLQRSSFHCHLSVKFPSDLLRWGLAVALNRRPVPISSVENALCRDISQSSLCWDIHSKQGSIQLQEALFFFRDWGKSHLVCVCFHFCSWLHWVIYAVGHITMNYLQEHFMMIRFTVHWRHKRLSLFKCPERSCSLAFLFFFE